MSDITILDGGMGKELRRIGAPFRQPEWSALALLEAPEFVTKAHQNFVDAGAEIIITNTYAVVPHHIGIDRFRSRGRELATLAARAARSVADQAGRAVAVAGSLPPPFGSYRPDDFMPDRAPDIWRALIEAQAADIDLWIGETLSSIVEFDVLVATLDRVAGADIAGKGLWAGFTLADQLDDGRARLRSGQSMTEVAVAVDRARSARSIEAVVFNCSQPEVIAPAVAELRAVGHTGPIGAYANAFPTESLAQSGYASNAEILERRADLTPERYADLAGTWIEVGATIIGGCCDIYPAHIAELRRRFKPKG